MLSTEQQQRYDRNIRIPGFGEEGQARLFASKALIVGLGGLGSPVAQYLCAAGVGTLGLLDSDVLELSNLQRQVLHSTPKLGHLKAESAAETLAALNREVQLKVLPHRLTEANAGELFAQYDVVVECSDNFETKFLINDMCLAYRKPFATAGILSLSGQAMFVVPGQTPCLRCAVPEIPEGVPTTAELGVLGAVPGILGSIEALELIRYLTGVWKPQSNGQGLLHTVNGDAMRLATMRIPRRPDCRCASLWSES
ncbi:MAG: HesA/MoeB/ThiF family protein [FCB group bacterium]|jgi:adenylyltransferase/sulfurtransferase|nr:HesA/MoeB/ThiF family protein [FCB group bacterium]